MTNLYKLNNQVKHYEWGSPDLIPRLMGVEADGKQWAELWMGSHSRMLSPDNVPGGEIAEQYGDLPFLFKLLAAEKPLSIQVHPNLEQAREGFERENKAGLPPDDPNRNYHDPNHKPEIICALTPFTGMCGFRDPIEIRIMFSAFLLLVPDRIRKNCVPLLQALDMPAENFALRNFFRFMFSLSPAVRRELTDFILSADIGGDEWDMVQKFARLYPGDPAMLSPLYLNTFCLEPGEALFLPAGVPHSYIHGLGVELMANSDNVLRGGLTTKHIDIPELMKVMDYNPLELQIMEPEPGAGCFTYPAPCKEFSLTVMHATGGSEQTFTPNTPTICIVTEGEVSIGDTVLKQGESAFVPPGSDPLVLQGRYTLYIASVPLS